MRKLLVFLIGGAALGLVWLVAFRAGPVPEIAIEPGAKWIGRKTPITVRVAEPQRGLAFIKVELVQGDLVHTLAEARHAPTPSWAIWRTGTASDEIRLEVGKDSVEGLVPGTATVRVIAGRAGAALRSPDPVTAQIELPVRLTPPSIEVLSHFNYVSQGGSEAVVYRVGDAAIRDGVRAGAYFFPGYPLPGGAAGERFALFAVPYDIDDTSAVRLVALDAAGNEGQLSFIDRFFRKPLRRDAIRLNDGFMQKVTTEIMSRTPELADRGSLLENYLQINRDLRKRNDAFLRGLAARSAGEFLWREPFLPMVNTAIKASFADRRLYTYAGNTVDEQDHLGLDMASVRADKIPASNDGVVLFAGYLGIYGNCVVIDHGYGVQTLYGHLSSIDVKEGERIARGQAIGETGATGLAGGDHLHFAIMLEGLPVSPIEWFDRKWIHDRLKLKLGDALPFEGKGRTGRPGAAMTR
jgi:murein DD-endopeptidase MepM/ murein hydrolase activator NlpD